MYFFKKYILKSNYHYNIKGTLKPSYCSNIEVNITSFILGRLFYLYK
jgi:hypothetical protein